MSAVIAICIGACVGALARWQLSVHFNHGDVLPWGTLYANLIGGYLIGIAVEYFMTHAGLPSEWRLFVIVGFLGGLTTFSSFSAEAVELLSDRDFLWSFVLVASHMLGSLAMTWLGILTARSLSA